MGPLEKHTDCDRESGMAGGRGSGIADQHPMPSVDS